MNSDLSSSNNDGHDIKINVVELTPTAEKQPEARKSQLSEFIPVHSKERL